MKNFEEFCKLCDKAHKEIKEFANKEYQDSGMSFSEKTRQQIFQNDINYIIGTLPKYLADNKLTMDKLTEPVLKINKKEIKLSKHIMTYAKKHLPEVTCSHLNNFVSNYVKKISEKQKNKENNIHYIVSIDPKDFVSIGSYSFDNGCFRDGGMNEDKKLNIAITKNSFCFLAKTNNEVISRALCFLDLDNEILDVFNLKFKYYNTSHVITEIFKKIYKDIFKKDVMHIQEHTAKVENGLTYCDSHSSYSHKPVKNRVINVDPTYSYEYHPTQDPYAGNRQKPK